METFRVPHHLARKDKFQSGCHINLVTEPDFPLVLSPQTSFLFTLNLFYAISEHKSGCTFFCEAVFMCIDRAHWNKLVWKGIYGMTEKSVQKVFSFMREEISGKKCHHQKSALPFARSCGSEHKVPEENKCSFCVWGIWEKTWITPWNDSGFGMGKLFM